MDVLMRILRRSAYVGASQLLAAGGCLGVMLVMLSGCAARTPPLHIQLNLPYIGTWLDVSSAKHVDAKVTSPALDKIVGEPVILIDFVVGEGGVADDDGG